MKQIKQLSIWIIALAGWMIGTGAAQAQQYDFKHGALFYKITKSNPPVFEVKVVSENAGKPYYSAGYEPKGAITIPKSFSRKVGALTLFYNVMEIGGYAFHGCKGITSVTIPDGITGIGKWAFRECDGITTVSIPGSVKTIGENAFDDCNKLKSVTIHEGVQLISGEAFEQCFALETVDIPASVIKIEKSAFRVCTALKTVTVHWDTPLAVPDEIFLDVNTAHVTLKVPKGTKEAYEKAAVWKGFNIDDGTTKDYDFAHNGLFYKITKSTPPVFEVKVVPEMLAYPHYSSGKNEPKGEIFIPGSFSFNSRFYKVIAIEKNAFLNCDGITSVSISQGITSIGRLSFAWSNAISAIDIPASVTTIDESAFWDCTGLKTVTVHWNTPLAVPDDIFAEVNTANVTLKVPKGTKEAYEKAAVWKDFRIDDGTPDVVPVTGVTLNHHKVTVNADITQKQLTATVKPANATNKSVTWKSNNPAVASVDAKGLVTIHKKGQATVTATANDGSGHSDACLFDVIGVVANETVDGLRVFAAGSALYLTLPKAETVHIYNVEGALVKTLTLSAGDHVQPLPSGVYLVQTGEQVTKVLVK